MLQRFIIQFQLCYCEMVAYGRVKNKRTFQTFSLWHLWGPFESHAKDSGEEAPRKFLVRSRLRRASLCSRVRLLSGYCSFKSGRKRLRQVVPCKTFQIKLMTLFDDLIIIIVSITKLSFVIGSLRAYLSRDLNADVTPIWTFCNWTTVIGYPSDFHVNYARFNGFSAWRWSKN